MIEKILSNKLFQSFLIFAIFRAIYGFIIVLIAYFFSKKFNLSILGSMPIFIVSILLSRIIYKKLKLRFNL